MSAVPAYLHILEVQTLCTSSPDHLGRPCHVAACSCRVCSELRAGEKSCQVPAQPPRLLQGAMVLQPGALQTPGLSPQSRTSSPWHQL